MMAVVGVWGQQSFRYFLSQESLSALESFDGRVIAGQNHRQGPA